MELPGVLLIGEHDTKCKWKPVPLPVLAPRRPAILPPLARRAGTKTATGSCPKPSQPALCPSTLRKEVGSCQLSDVPSHIWLQVAHGRSELSALGKLQWENTKFPVGNGVDACPFI